MEWHSVDNGITYVVPSQLADSSRYYRFFITKSTALAVLFVIVFSKYLGLPPRLF